eukprot:5386928-Pleurochrysis_carterae.AAC.1
MPRHSLRLQQSPAGAAAPVLAVRRFLKSFLCASAARAAVSYAGRLLTAAADAALQREEGMRDTAWRA